MFPADSGVGAVLGARSGTLLNRRQGPTHRRSTVSQVTPGTESHGLLVDQRLFIARLLKGQGLGKASRPGSKANLLRLLDLRKPRTVNLASFGIR